MLDSMLNRWIAVQVRPQSEKMVALLLRYKGYEDFLPQYVENSPSGSRKNSRERSIFPGYLFCRVTPAAHGLVVTTPGVIRIVSAGPFHHQRKL